MYMATVTNIYGSGSPAIFTTVTKGPGGPILRPYPDWNWYNSMWYCKCLPNECKYSTSLIRSSDFLIYMYMSHIYILYLNISISNNYQFIYI